MPFKKNKSGTYTSPSGKKYTEEQVKMYYATQGFKNSKKKKKKK